MVFTCNQSSFSNVEGDIEVVSYIIISLNACLLLFLLVKMCRLCSYAFSYSNYHIHETYKLYALCIINIMATLLVRKTQLDLKHFIDTQNEDLTKPSANLLGYWIINDLFGIISIVTNNILLLFNSFSWLAIAKNCDYTVTNSNKSVQPEQILSGEEDSVTRLSQNKSRRAIYVAKVYFLYCFLPLLLVLAIFGTLSHKNQSNYDDNWCAVIDVSIVLSSVVPLIVFCIAFALYLKKFSDPQISRKTKVGLVYLLVRSIFFLVYLIKSSEESSTANPTAVFFSIFCSLGPMLMMAFLSQVELHKQQFNLLRRSTGLIFKSTII